MNLLFDCHIAKATLGALRKLAPDIQVEHLAGWRSGAFLRASDADILAACQEEHRTFVTFDQKTIPDLLRQLAAEDRPHSGVIFGDDKTLKPDNPSAVAVSLAALAKEIGNADTSNMIRFLRRVRM